MIDYKVECNKEGMVVYGPFDECSVPIEIPSNNENKERFINLFLNKADIERGIDYLRCISIDKSILENEAFFIAGLNNCVKCFQHNESRGHLPQSTVFKNNKELGRCFDRFLNMRNKHFIHDDNGMLQAEAFFLVLSEGENVWGGPPSVVWNRAKLDYYQEGLVLQKVMFFVRDYICKEIDRIGNSIFSEYKNYSREELLKFPLARIKLASANASECKR